MKMGKKKEDDDDTEDFEVESRGFQIVFQSHTVLAESLTFSHLFPNLQCLDGLQEQDGNCLISRSRFSELIRREDE